MKINGVEKYVCSFSPALKARGNMCTGNTDQSMLFHWLLDYLSFTSVVFKSTFSTATKYSMFSFQGFTCFYFETSNSQRNNVAWLQKEMANDRKTGKSRWV